MAWDDVKPQMATFGGYTARLSRIEMWWTYEGLLEGYPRRRWNDRKIESLRKRYPDVVVVGADQTPIEGAKPLATLGEAATLPQVTCVGEWECSRTTPHSTGDHDASSLKVVWFQDEMRLPLDERTLLLMRDINWADHAKNWTY